MDLKLSKNDFLFILSLFPDFWELFVAPCKFPLMRTNKGFSFKFLIQHIAIQFNKI